MRRVSKARASQRWGQFSKIVDLCDESSFESEVNYAMGRVSKTR
jgi:hypothetical protein